MEAAIEAPSVVASVPLELRAALRRARPAAEFLAREIVSLGRAGAWGRTALWSTVRQAQVEFADLFGRSPQSVLLAGRARLPQNLRLEAFNDDVTFAMLGRAFFAPFADAFPAGVVSVPGDVSWPLPGLLALSGAELGVFRLPGGPVAWVCGKKPPTSTFNGSGVFVVDGVGNSEPTIQDQRDAVARCLGFGGAEAPVRVVETGAGYGQGRNLSLLQGGQRLTGAEAEGVLPWIIWENASVKIGGDLLLTIVGGGTVASGPKTNSNP